MDAPRGRVVLKSLAVTAVIFGALTILSGGRALFGGEEAARAAGAIVSFVIRFNFVAGFAYVVCGLGLRQRKRRAAKLTAVIAATTALVFATFGVRVLTGCACEARTVGAMRLRALLFVVKGLTGGKGQSLADGKLHRQQWQLPDGVCVPGSACTWISCRLFALADCAFPSSS